MPSLSIGSAVGKQPALNRRQDQQTIIDLLERISATDGGSPGSLPPPTNGPSATPALINAILTFQRTMASRGLLPQKFVDSRVDPGGATLRLLNQHADFRRGGGGGRLIPVDPPAPPKPTPPKKGPGFLQGLFQKLVPRPTNLSISGSASVSFALFEFGAAGVQMKIANSRIGGSVTPTQGGGVGLSLGPIPFGIEIAPSDFPSFGSTIHAGPRTTTNVLAVDDILGICLLVGVSAGIIGGGNATTVLFNIGSNRSLKTLPLDFLNSAGPNVATNFLNDAFNTCKAWGSMAGVFAGLSVGVSMIEVLLVKQGADIRPDPDVRRTLNLRRR